MYVEKNDDGSLRPKLDTLVDEDECPKNLASMILQWHDGQIVSRSATALAANQSGYLERSSGDGPSIDVACRRG